MSPVRRIAELRGPSATGLRERFVDSPAGERIGVDDLGRVIGCSTMSRVAEYRLR